MPEVKAEVKRGMDWKKLLGSISKSVDEELRLRNEYLVTETRLLRQQLTGRVQLCDGDRQALAELGQKLGRKPWKRPRRLRKPVTILVWHHKLAPNRVTACRRARLWAVPRTDQELERRHDATNSMRHIMSNYAVTLPVPDYIYDRARQIAAGTAQSIEAVLLQQLKDAFAEVLPALPPDEQRELEALTHLSDEALWTIAREQMAQDRQARLHALMDANSQGTLGEAQQAELEALVAQGQRLSLRKAQAAALLTERGYRVTVEMLSSADE
jgi:hypothetical protein